MPKIMAIIKNKLLCIASIACKITKKMYRNAAVITFGAVIITVISFTSTGFGGGGKSSASDTVNTKYADEGEGDEETDSFSEIVEELTVDDMVTEGHILIGKQLSSDVIKKQDDEEKLIEEGKHKRAELEEYNRIQKEEEEKRTRSKNICETLCISSFTDEDYNNLLRIVHAEAGICDMEGRILVANVIINRVRSSNFPNTVSEVIFSPDQFSPIADGAFYSVNVDMMTREAVERAVWGEDYSQGALYFMSRSGSRNGNVVWFDSSLTYLFSHDGHEFFK